MRTSTHFKLVPWIVLAASLPPVEVRAQHQFKEDSPRWQVECHSAATRLDDQLSSADVVTSLHTPASGDLRIAALTVLAAYVNPTTVSILEHPEREHLVERYTVVQSPHAPTTQQNGAVPLGDVHTARIMDSIRRLASRGVTDERVSGAAELLLRWLEMNRM